MIKNALQTFGATARALIRRPRALLLFALLYAALLIALYSFVVVKEASVWQLTLTALLAVIAPLLFFIINAAGVSWTDADGAISLLRRALKDFWKLIIISLPLIALAVLIFYLLNKLQSYFPAVQHETARRGALLRSPAAPPPMPLHWSNVIFTSLRLLLLGVALPLAAVHLWIAATHRSFRATLKESPRLCALALAPRSILVYTLGLIAFAFVPYVLIFTRTQVSHAWLELTIFGLRLAFAFLLTLAGWLVTLGALAKNFNGVQASTTTMKNESGQVASES